MNLLLLNLFVENFGRQVRPQKGDSVGWCNDYKKPILSTSLAFLSRILMLGLVKNFLLNVQNESLILNGI